ADLSHVGGYFGDQRPLDEDLQETVRLEDEEALRWVEANDPEGLRRHVADTGNPTRWCSVGCLYATMTALGSGARAERLAYRQAATPEWQNCVTCAAFALTS